MPIVEWSDAYSVGIEQFDEHHRHLIGLLNTVYDSFADGSSEEVVESFLDELADYATYHFTAEEFWMREIDYPFRDAHNREHNSFARRVMDIQRDFAGGKKGLTLEILSFLKTWLTNHILTSDVDYKNFLAGSRPGAAAGSPGDPDEGGKA